jgi:hypothetical protein
LTEPDSEPNRAMVWQQRWICPLSSVMGWSRCTLGYGQSEGCVDEPGPETREAHYKASESATAVMDWLPEPEPQSKRAMVQSNVVGCDHAVDAT